MASTLFGAFEELFGDSTALTTSAPGGLWLSFAPEGTSEPFCVMVPVSSVTAFTTGDPYVDIATVQFNVFGQTGASVYTAMQDLEKAFDWQEKSLSLGEDEIVLGLMRTNEIGPFSAEDNIARPSGQPATWQGVVEYNVIRERTLAR